jgi:hypothetical protein
MPPNLSGVKGRFGHKVEIILGFGNGSNRTIAAIFD